MAEQQPEVKIKKVQKKGGHGGAHGGAWKVAYADFVTAMMAFFLLMWLLNSANPNTKVGIAGVFQDPDFFKTERGKEILSNHGKGILPGGRDMGPGPDQGGAPETSLSPGAEQEKKAMEATKEAISKAFASDKLLETFKDQISMDFTDEGLRIQIADKATSVLFDSGSAKLKAYTLSILKEIARELGKLDNHIVIGGHTDSTQYPSGAAYTNWELSADRANAARRVLEASGLRKGQARRITGYGDKIPKEGADSSDPANRRISIVVLSSATLERELRSQKIKEKAEKPEKEEKEEKEEKPKSPHT